MAKWDTQTHDFPGTTIDTTFFPSGYGATPTIHDNLMDYSATSGYSGRVTQLHDLTESSFLLHVGAPVGGWGGFTIKSATNVDIADIQLRQGTNVVRGRYYGVNYGGTTTQTDITWGSGDRWFRATLTGTTLTFEQSTDGSTWTTVHSVTASAGAVTAMQSCKMELNCGDFPTTMTVGPTYSKINLPASGGTDAAASPAVVARPAAVPAPAVDTVLGVSPAAVVVGTVVLGRPPVPPVGPVDRFDTIEGWWTTVTAAAAVGGRVEFTGDGQLATDLAYTMGGGTAVLVQWFPGGI